MNAILQEYAPYFIGAAFIVGSWVGFSAACLFAVGREADERQERCREKIAYMEGRDVS